MNKSIWTVIGMLALVGILAVLLWVGLNALENGEIADQIVATPTPTVTPTATPTQTTSSKTEKDDKDLTDTKLNIVASLEDKITDNSVWCGTLNLIWNDLKNDIAKKDIVFIADPDNVIVKNLNKGTFTTKEVSEESYYKVYGIATLELKSKIEQAIKEKFNETSDILDDFDWANAGPDDYFLYVMLKKKFEFNTVFTELEKGKFKDTENVEFFGIDAKTSQAVKNQVKVLYYGSKDDFAVELTTKQKDRVIIARGLAGDNFKDIYQELKNKKSKFTGLTNIGDKETLKIPNIEIDLKKDFTELEHKDFYFAKSETDSSNGELYRIDKALQTIKLKLNKEGGEVKSEAGMMVVKSAVFMPEEVEIREFNVDDTFTMFLIEEGKDLPYLAMKISNINEVQKINK